ncbi:RCC1/BLIP-II [Ophiobolus disseminans]|uniref:RCC1/BLIP-II n=1 Tax=Ophiobolus disseminans TaxID=1469910 RepID=A0A6A7A5E0_9PLEO|nr:RCC1/BLIP-II [Ophiobolus disseminans]
MARATASRAASAKPAKEVKANGTARGSRAVAATNGYAEADLEPESEIEAEAAPVTKKLAGRARAKKTETPAPEPKPEPSKAVKRKKADASDNEEEAAPEPKKTKVAPPPKATKATKAKPKAAPKAAKAKVEEPKVEPEEAAEADNDEDMDAASEADAAEPEEEKKPGNWDEKPIVKGPRRVRGQRNEIVSVRYTDPLKVFVFGEGSNGELGLGATKKAIDVKRPRYNELLSKYDVVRVATGGMHVLALTKDNQILSWGVNDNGALGRDTSGAEVKTRDLDADDSDSDDDETGGLIDLEATPSPVSPDYFPANTTFVDIAAGDSCSFALTTEGAVYGWGTFRKNEGIMGFRTKGDTAFLPVYIEGITKATHIASGTNHILALTKDGHVYAWGNGQQNQLGRRLTERNLTEGLVPSKVGFRDLTHKRVSHKMVSIASGDYHSFAIADDGQVWSWGVNNFCETGYPANAGADDALVLTPRIVSSLEGKNVAVIAGGSHHNVAITKDGQALVWGRCDGSQTGLSRDLLASIQDETRLLLNNDKPKILIEPTPLPDLKNIVFGACGPDTTIVIDKDGKAYSWGFSTCYQTGQGTTDDIEVPTLIDNTAVRETKLAWTGCGGQYSMLASVLKV